MIWYIIHTLGKAKERKILQELWKTTHDAQTNSSTLMMNTFLINNSLKTVLGKIYILECLTSSTILRIVFRYQRWWWEWTHIIFSDIRLNNIWNLTVSLGVFWLAVHIYWKWINPSGMINIRDSADSRADGSCSNCDIIALSSPPCHYLSKLVIGSKN